MVVQPYKRPRRVPLFRKGEPVFVRGNCYPYACHEALAYLEAGSPRPGLRVVHGTVGIIEHAWIERGGYAYDWQMFADDGAAAQPLPIAEYYERKQARAEKRYTAKQVLAKLDTGRYGPWHASVAKYEGIPGMTPEAIARLVRFQRAELRRADRRTKGGK